MEEWGEDYEIICVNDGSPDNTLEILETIQGIQLKNIQPNQGKGNALRVGFSYATGEVLAFLDADLFLDLSYIKLFYARLKKGECVIASKYCDGASYLPKPNIVRRVMSKTLRLIVAGLCNLQVTDTQCGFKMFYAEDYRKIEKFIESKGWLFDLELLCYLKNVGVQIVEYPTQCKNEYRSTISSVKGMVQSTFQMLQVLYRIQKRKRGLDLCLKQESI